GSIATWRRFVQPDDLEASGELLEKHFHGDLDYYECEARMKHKNGDWIWLLDRGKVATWTKDGKPLLMSGTHQDITKRKQAEATLRETLAETERMNRLMRGRETRLRELKDEVNALSQELGRRPVYAGAATGTVERIRTVAAPALSAPAPQIRYEIVDRGLEKPAVDVVFIPIVCSAPLLYAKTHGYFARNGLDVTLAAAPGWSGVKDMLAYGHTDAAHMLTPMALASREGLDGKRADIRLSAIQNING
ncbi:MAG: ABC transporter substrate-binding protein, partial [bacterium]|nr:ABC transporter substrate-binding protein [bacterium]